jgi:hypothetical protein
VKDIRLRSEIKTTSFNIMSEDKDDMTKVRHNHVSTKKFASTRNKKIKMKQVKRLLENSEVQHSPRITDEMGIKSSNK